MFDALVEEVKKLPLQEVRSESKEHLEAVVQTSDMDSLHPVLEKHLGKAIILQPGVTPDEVITFMQGYGGVMPGQGLYFLKKDGFTTFAMIWPWGNRVSATLKMRQVKTP